MNNYYRILNNFILTSSNIEFLQNMCETYRCKALNKSPSGSVNYGPDYRAFYLKTANVSYKNNSFFSDMLKILSNIKTHNTLDKIYDNSHIAIIDNVLKPHVDRRQCVISFAIQPIEPLYWYNTPFDKNYIRWPLEWTNVKEYASKFEELCSMTYPKDKLVLVNTKIPHGNLHGVNNRILFQIGGFTDGFDEVFSLIN